MDEKEKILKESLEKLEIPESLRPENIEKIVDETDAAEKKQSKKLLKWKYPAKGSFQKGRTKKIVVSPKKIKKRR